MDSLLYREAVLLSKKYELVHLARKVFMIILSSGFFLGLSITPVGPVLGSSVYVVEK